MDRFHVLIRLVLLFALGGIGCSSVYWVLYLALPALAAVLIAQKGRERYLAEDGETIVRTLRWFAAAYSYLWLLTDAFPTLEGAGPVEFRVEPGGGPTPSSALFRIVSSLPALVFLAVLSFAASFLWVIGAVAVVLFGRVPPAITDFLSMTLRYQFRLFAYHLSLVERYPSFDEGSAAQHTSPSGAV